MPPNILGGREPSYSYPIRNEPGVIVKVPAEVILAHWSLKPASKRWRGRCADDARVDLVFGIHPATAVGPVLLKRPFRSELI